MILMILRHGKAEKDPPTPTGKDADRALAERGVRQAEFIARQFLGTKSSLPRPAIILSSRAVRARGTATIVADALKMRVTLDDALRLGTPVSELMPMLRKLAKRDEPAMIVGHNPQLEELVETLTGTDEELRTGEMVCLDVRLVGKKLDARGDARFRLDGE